MNDLNINKYDDGIIITRYLNLKKEITISNIEDNEG